MKLRAVNAPLRAIAYVRISEEGGRGEDLLSDEIQDTAIGDHCSRRGYRVVERFVDIDRTGTIWRGRKIEQAVAMIEAGQADVIVVWKVSRVARNRRDWALAVDRVEGVGGSIESATEQLDTTTSTGRFTRGMLAELAAFESERMGETWKEVHRTRTDAGLPHYGPQRLGYSYDHATGYAVDQDQAVIVRQLYRRFIAGEGLHSLTMWLRAEGATGARGKPWSRFGVAYYMKSGFAAGLLYAHDPACRCGKKRGSCANRIHRPGAHAAIITAEEWASYERIRRERGTLPVKSRVPVSKLAGVVICAGCDRPMQLQASSGKPRHAYVCRTNRMTISECSAPGWVKREECEKAVREKLAEVAEELDALVEDAPVRPVQEARRKRLARKVAEIDAALGKLTVDLARGLVPESAYEVARDEMAAERNVALVELEKLQGPDLTAISAGVLGLLAIWDTAEPHETASAVRDLVRVQVTRGVGILVVPTWIE